MTNKPSRIWRRLLISEVVQTSSMDCGPASLKCLIEGFGINISYGRLREACQTSVDGASINNIEDVGVQLGLKMEQVMLPVEYLLYPEANALPAMVVVRAGHYFTHFVVAWRYNLGFVQIMDPSVGRRWMTAKQFQEWLYIHTLPVSAKEWRKWAGSEEALRCMERSLGDLRLSPTATITLIDAALGDESWRSLAALQAAARMVGSMVSSSGTKSNSLSTTLLESLFEQARSADSGCDEIIAASYWPVLPVRQDTVEDQQLLLHGAVLLRVHGLRNGYQPLAEVDTNKEHRAARKSSNIDEEETDRLTTSEAGVEDLPQELLVALKEPPTRPIYELLQMMRADGFLAPAILIKALFVSTCCVVGTAVLFRGLLDIGNELAVGKQRAAAFGLVLLFFILQFVQGLPISIGFLRLGRHLEIRLRVSFLEKLARLDDRYFRSRLMSDMAERCHSVQFLRTLPFLAQTLLQNTFQLILTIAGIIWLAPSSTSILIMVVVIAAGSTLALQPLLIERDLRIRTHTGALSRFYLNALLGLIPVRAHAAERAVRGTHERLLIQWMHACFSLQRAAIGLGAIQSVVGLGLAIWLLCSVIRPADVGRSLLLIYWTLSLPSLGQTIVTNVLQYPICRNIMLRLLEPLGAPEHSEASGDNAVRLQPADKDTAHAAEVQTAIDEPAQPLGIAIAFEGVYLTISGHIILNKVDLRIDSGSHVAIVGPSGAGKTSLVGLLLGWCRPSGGRILIDGIPFNGERLKRLREETAWIDPSLQLWNRSLIDNLNYGASPESIASLGEIVEMAELRELLEILPDGLQTHLGEGGALVSGGEGQRVRLGRAMQRRDARLVILDEPFTGLARPQRERLLLRARELWQNATLLYVTHSIDEAAAFERVLVLDAANIVEDGAPHRLIQQENSRYRAMWESECAVRKGFMTSENWRRLRVETGQLTEMDKWAKSFDHDDIAAMATSTPQGALVKEQPPAFN